MTLEEDLGAPRLHHQRDRRRTSDGDAGRSRSAARATSRRACCAMSAPAFAEDPLRVLRGGALHGALRAAGLHRRAGNAGADARDGRQRRSSTDLVPERVWQELRARARQRRRRRRSCARCATAARWRCCCPKSTRCTACRSAPNTTRRSTPACTSNWSATWPRGWRPATTLIGFAALTHDLGKALTPADVLPKHIGHEQRRPRAAARRCASGCKVPTEHRQLAEAACREHLNVHRFDELRAADRARPDRALRRLPQAGAHRRSWRWCARPTSAAAPGCGDEDYPQGRALRAAHAAALAVRARRPGRANCSGPALGEAVRKARIAAIAAVTGKR